ncbi:MAG: M23 family metallopeptidase [Bacteroidota bacterium]
MGIGLLIPQNLQIPVEGATADDWNAKTFWYHPWGRSGTHKGVDIFAKKGTPVRAATGGWVLRANTGELGGVSAWVLGPKWRLHYYAHLDTRAVSSGDWVWQGELIGTVGDTGNAKGKPAHLHYTLATLLPYSWRADDDPQGWKKIFILNPLDYFP